MLSVAKVTSDSKAVLKNEAIIAVMSASIVAPFVVPKINSLMDTVPILRDHKSIAAFVSGYGSGVTVALGSYNSFASDIAHHFYRVRVKSTSSGNHTTFKVFWNYVSLNN